MDTHSTTSWFSIDWRGRRTQVVSLTLAVMLLVLAFMSCRDSSRPVAWRLPAPTVQEVPYQFVGYFSKAHSGDSLEILDANGITHLIRLIGVDCPEPSQSSYGDALRLARRLAWKSRLTVFVMKRDDHSVEISEVFAGEQNLGLVLVRCGLGWYNGEDFPGSDQYSAAHAQAQREKLEIWSHSSPTPPWEKFHQQSEQRRHDVEEVFPSRGNQSPNGRF